MDSRDTKVLCSTCLSKDRQLFLLNQIPGGIKLLHMIKNNTDANMDSVNNISSWLICWECRAIMQNVKRFQQQVCTALKHLKDIAAGRNKKVDLLCLSHLSIKHNPPITIELGTNINNSDVKEEIYENLIKDFPEYYENEANYDETEEANKNERKPQEKKHKQIKTENEHSPLHENESIIYYDDTELFNEKEHTNYNKSEVINKKQHTNNDETKLRNQKEHKRPINNKKEHIPPNKNTKSKKLYSVSILNDKELKTEMDKRKSELKSDFKCDSCVLDFKNDGVLNTHNLKLHTKKENHSRCTICLSYIKEKSLDTHTKKHYRSHVCSLCAYTASTLKQIIGHLSEMHGRSCDTKKKQIKKDCMRKTVSYSCSECDMIFKDRGAKWKHVQKSHRAGHKCATCGKVFSFKHNLERHELSHTNSHPRTSCPTCHKQVRASLLRTHMRTHSARTVRHACEPCGTAYRARAAYHAHLKYARAHAPQNEEFRYPCTTCDKKYRSAGELRDHVSYRHENQPSHKCPICDKGLATQRCVTRHVRRAHDGIKENERDKMCDYCGQTFRDKKSLREHIWRHTGARPLSCARCGRAFRQRAALHAHTRRLHANELT